MIVRRNGEHLSGSGDVTTCSKFVERVVAIGGIGYDPQRDEQQGDANAQHCLERGQNVGDSFHTELPDERTFALAGL